jgi:hypothetical protein
MFGYAVIWLRYEDTELTRPQIWKVETNGDDRKVTYLSTLKKHSQAVNVVRWCPRGTIDSSPTTSTNTY